MFIMHCIMKYFVVLKLPPENQGTNEACDDTDDRHEDLFSMEVK